MLGTELLGWAVALMWAGVGVWVYFDAKRSHRAALANAIATFLLPGVGLAVYLGGRGAAARASDDGLTNNGQALLREMTTEVERLRAELSATQAELADLRARQRT